MLGDENEKDAYYIRHTLLYDEIESNLVGRRFEFDLDDGKKLGLTVEMAVTFDLVGGKRDKGNVGPNGWSPQTDVVIYNPKTKKHDFINKNDNFKTASLEILYPDKDGVVDEDKYDVPHLRFIQNVPDIKDIIDRTIHFLDQQHYVSQYSYDPKDKNMEKVHKKRLADARDKKKMEKAGFRKTAIIYKPRWGWYSLYIYIIHKKQHFLPYLNDT